VFAVVKVQVFLDVSMDKGAGGDHLCIQPGVPGDEAVQVAAVAVCPV